MFLVAVAAYDFLIAKRGGCITSTREPAPNRKGTLKGTSTNSRSKPYFMGIALQNRQQQLQQHAASQVLGKMTNDPSPAPRDARHPDNAPSPVP